MKLSVRWATATAILTAATTMLVTATTQESAARNLEPVEISRLDSHVELLAAGVQDDVRVALGDVAFFAKSSSVVELAGSLAAGLDSHGDAVQPQLRRLQNDLIAAVEARPNYLQLRFLDVDGRELVRVDRDSQSGEAVVVDDAQLQNKGTRQYFLRARAAPAGAIYVSPIELNQEHGEIERPVVPVLRAATRVDAASGEPTGVVVLNVDMRPSFEKLRRGAFAHGDVYALNSNGEFLVHPDRSKEFAHELHPQRAPVTAKALEAFKSAPSVARDVAYEEIGERRFAARATATLADHTEITVIESVPYDAVLARAAAVRRWSWLVGLALAVIAAIGAAAMARSMARPIEDLTAAIQAFPRTSPKPLPTAKNDEIGVLARAFEALASDVTAKRIELERRGVELERSNADLEQFAYVASHDLQEPLRMVSCYTELLSERLAGDTDEKTKSYMSTVIKGACRMRDQIHGLLEYSRVGSSEAPMERVNLSNALDTVLFEFQTTIQDSGAVIERGELPVVNGVSSQLVAVFRNLIGNALKYRSEAAPRIRVDAERAGEYWRIRVRDNGIGIEPRYKDRVFRMFSRLHSRSKYEGHGIGLAVTKRIVERHGGAIAFESAPGAGATFLFTLRCDLATPPALPKTRDETRKPMDV